MQVIDAIAAILKKEGVTCLFCYPTTPLIEAIAAAGIRPIVCRQERAGVDMAHGFARVTNGHSTAVFAMQYGPGAENSFAGVASAFSDSVPMLLLPLGHPRATSQVFPMFRSSRSYASITKSAEEITTPEQVPDVMRRAFNHLRNGRLGPVMVELPSDVARLEVDAAAVEGYQPVRSTRSMADWRDVDDAAAFLLEASSPIIQAGQGVLYASATRELIELAELLQIPVMTTVDGKSAFPEDHPLSLGTAGAVMTGDCRDFLIKADVVFGVGTSFTRHHLVNPILPSDKKIIHATNDARDLYKGYNVEIPVLGDAKLVLRQLIDAVSDRLAGKTRTNEVAAQIKTLRQRWLLDWEKKLQSNEVPITPYRVMHEFIKNINPADAIVTHDSGSPRDQLLPFYHATQPNGYLGWGKSHQLGTGLGLTIGAKLARPDKFCVNFMGDAAFGMTGFDFETAIRCKVPILTIVLNNSTMAIETKTMKVSHDLFRTRDIGGNYANLARDLGGWSKRVTEPGEIADAILLAKSKTEEGHAALLEFVTSEETEFSFRVGAAHLSNPSH